MTRADDSAASRADALRLAERMREACVRTFAEAYEEAGLLGLCAEGRFEAAVGAIRSLDLETLVGAAPETPPDDAQESSR